MPSESSPRGTHLGSCWTSSPTSRPHEARLLPGSVIIEARNGDEGGDHAHSALLVRAPLGHPVQSPAAVCREQPRRSWVSIASLWKGAQAVHPVDPGAGGPLEPCFRSWGGGGVGGGMGVEETEGKELVLWPRNRRGSREAEESTAGSDTGFP